MSDEDLKQLLEIVRDLTVRIHRIERVLRLSPEAGPSPPPLESGLQGTPPSRVVAGGDAERAPVPSPSFAHARISEPGQREGLEARIGSHWLNRIGITAVLVGAAYFLKFAFDNQWIGPSGRIAIGLISGVAVVLWSERFRAKGYRLFSYALKAVGVGVLYLSLWASFQVYHLMPNGVVFACMILVTAASCALALTQDAEILAVYAIVGGFLTPVLLSTGVNREVALFSYVVLLDLGLLAVVVFKPWRRLLWLGFAGTLILYLAWYFEYYDRKQIETTLIFASLFFAIFAISPLLMLRQEHGAGSMPLALAFVNAVTFFLQAYAMISEISKTEMAWFSLTLAAVYLGLNTIRSRSDQAAESNLRLMHLALAIGLITVAIPIRLESHWITIGWFIESAVLLWLGGRIKSDLLNVFALTALVLGVLRLLFYDNFAPTTLIFNIRMAVYVIAIAVLGFVAYQSRTNQREEARTIAAVAIVALNALALVALSYEIHDYYSRQIASGLPAPAFWAPEHWSQMRAVEIARGFTYSALFMAYGAMLMIVGFLRNSAFVRWQALVLIAATIVKVFVYDVSELDRVYRILSFIVLGVLLLAISFAYQRDWLKLSHKIAEQPGS
ncbi:MAG TPA: DUF2339 domain-containing protein [Terriglobales bacterium]|nr:DUF2339 domain-containing protein [Terriglobales bacterium]